MRFNWSCRTVALVLSCLSITAIAGVEGVIPNLKHFSDATGDLATYSTSGNIDRKSAFFQSLGTNGRTCETCHQTDQAFSLAPEKVQQLYDRTHGKDPLFNAFDGANCPDADPADRAAHSLLLSHGLIRVAITVPVHPQFTISLAHDPYGCAVRYDPVTNQQIISVYRRPLPTANLRFLSTVMFDGRETGAPLTDANTFSTNLTADLTGQAISAVLGHAQGAAPPTAAQLADIVNFEMGLSTAQTHDNNGGDLEKHGASGGPMALSKQAYYPGSNDSLGHDPHGEAFNPVAFSLYDDWTHSSDQQKRDIAAGQLVFNTAVATITDVRGLNDNPALGSPASIAGTCTTCHDTPNVGNHSAPLPLDIGTSRLYAMETNPSIVAGLQHLSAPDMPVFEINGCPDPQHPGHTLTFYTSDPGKALITGLCSDINRGKGPVLRGLAARAPYFHNGAAANLDELVDFYDFRFQMNLSSQQKHDLVAFLNSL